ncbi:DEAD/DEAH box helicase [Mycobacterium sherrisii]|uniref:DEAD/DEAH box helicase n=1 Tax=Mycobacterium sherrisii TaxID=243061 RepID=A0A1E3SQ32_9MYCO|nr:DEAD/DEAH box helicase [Mycobacterium sherrisii]MCV7032080.1 DEAD/DEAH box helicase [Mycobacterium sherrisii]MEC4764684.1 DEAD/DEAH box helicase [Mycobacterium sherrisii]ODR04209.1 DEAD/DEAH box helicase [Mycobacterium sherrisii]ORW76667.1 DEAD/DEAH box helicase [Mycobacterium sherrisii]
MTTDKTFADLGVPQPVVDALVALGITHPFPIQVYTLPDTLAGKDVLGRGKTGSGKTLAFSIPLVSGLSGRGRRPSRPSGLVLAPTRELASQITATLEPLAAAQGLRVTTIFGGVPQGRQITALRAGADIVVACPGRLEDLMKQRLISLEAVEITVIDEADHMADLGFLPAVTRILAATPNGGQRLLFSATLDNGVDKLVKRFLRNEVLHSVEGADSPVSEMTHHVFHVADVEAKKAVVHRLASGTGRRILFLRTKHQARKLARQLTESGVPSVDLHGNLSQAARERNLASFASGSARVLVATDIAARGVHVDEVELVVHIDPPSEHKSYLHRSGRTARAGSAGDVVTVVLPEQRRDTEAMMRKAGIKVAPQHVSATSEAVQALVGEIAPYRAPAPVHAPAPQRPAGGAKRRRRNSPRTPKTTGAPTEAVAVHRNAAPARRPEHRRRVVRAQGG